MRIFRQLLIILSISISAFAARAQNNTGSPYSAYGYGLITENAGPYNSMGGISAGMRDNININYLNPASYTAMDSCRWNVQLGVNGEFTHLSTRQRSANYRVAQNTAFSIGTRIIKNLYTSIGFSELSDIGYDLTFKNIIPGSLTEKYTQMMHGEGGINQFHFGLAWKIKNLSIGANLGAIFGKLERRQTLSIPIDNAYSIRTSDKSSIHDLLLKFGFQYEILPSELKGKDRLVLGTAFSFPSKFYAKQTYTSYKINSAHESVIIENEELTKGYIEYPFNITAGLTWYNGDKWLLGGDYTFQNMSEYKEYKTGKSLKDYHKANIGFSCTPQKSSSKWGKRNSYEIGGYMVRSHIFLNEKHINTYALTAGMLIPFFNMSARSELNFRFSIDYGIRGTEANSLMRENFFKFRVNVTFKEIWFTKRKIN